MDTSNFDNFFTDEFFEKLSNDYDSTIVNEYKNSKQIQKMKNFTSNINHIEFPGKDERGYNKSVDKYLLKKTRYKVWYKNLLIVCYIIDNYEKFKNFKFLDNGCRSGVLSCLLKEMNIETFNFDLFCSGPNEVKNPSEMSRILKTSDFYNRQGTKPTTDSISPEELKTIDCLTSVGVWVNDKRLVNHKYKFLFLDSKYCLENFKHKLKINLNFYEQIDDLDGIKVFQLK